MKKLREFIATVMLFVTVFSLFTCVPVMAAKKGVSYTAENNSTTLRGGQNFIFRNVDFTPGFTSVDITVRMGANVTTLTMKIDGVTGTNISDTLRLEINDIVPAWGWGTYNMPLTKQPEGVHDVYLSIGSGEVNPPTLTFNYWDGSKVFYEPYSEEYSYNDEIVPDNFYKIDFLSNLGIFDKSQENFDGDLPVTRIDFIKALSNFYDKDTVTSVPVSIFKDVKREDDKSAAYLLYQKGVVVLEDTAYLKPTEYITVNEAGMYIANMLGYSSNSYVASRMTAGVKTEDNHIRRKDMADILYNAVFEAYRTIEHDYKGSYSYKEHTDGILYYTKGLYKTEGVVTANYFTGVYSTQDATGEEYVQIDNTRYLIGETKADRYLGIKSKIIYEEKNGVRTIKAIAPLNPEGVVIFDNDYRFKAIDNNAFSYYTSGDKYKTLKFNKNTRFIYNGKALDSNIEAIIPDASKIRGQLVFVDNNNDKIYDFCIITNARSVIVKSVSYNILSDKITNETINFETDATVDFINKGNKVDSGDISIGMAVDLYESKNLSGEKLYTIHTGTSIEGQIVEKRDENGETVCVLSSTEVYKISPYAKTEIPMLEEGIFHINSFNEIVHFEAASENSLTLGWAIGYAKSSDPFVDEAYARIKTTDNKINDYKFAKRVIADGISIKDYNELVSGTSSFKGIDNLEKQKPVLFRLNEDNEISIIDTEHGTAQSAYNQLTCIMPSKEYRCYSDKFFDVALFDGIVQSGSAKGFAKASTYRYMMSVFDDEAYNTFSKWGAISDVLRKYTGYSFKTNSYTADLVVFQISGAGGDQVRPFLVKDLSKVYRNDEVVTKMTVVTSDGQGIDYYINSDVYSNDADYRVIADTLKEGDLLTGNLETQARTMTKLVPIAFVDNKYDGTADTRTNGESTVTAAINTTSNFYNFNLAIEDKTIKATVTDVSDEYIELTFDLYTEEGLYDKTVVDIGSLSDVNIFRIFEDGKVESGIAKSSLYEGQVLVAHYSYWDLSAIYIYDSLN